MIVEIIETYREFEAIQVDWDTVYQQDSEAKFFLSWPWLAQVFRQHSKSWCILAAKPSQAASNYVAFFPLRPRFRWSRHHQLYGNEIHMAGTLSWADYTGLICLPEFERPAIESLADQLKKMSWNNLYLKHFDASDRRCDLLLSQFGESTYQAQRSRPPARAGETDTEICPYIDLPGDFETYLQEQISTNTRQKIRRLLRKLEASVDLRITHATKETHARDLDFLIDSWKSMWAGRKGPKVEGLGEKYRDIVQQGLVADQIFLPVLWRGDTPLGALACFVDWQKKGLLYYLAGRDQRCKKPPPGLLLHAHSIQWAIDQGLKSYDFLRGNEGFKYSFGATDRNVRNLVVRSKSAELRRLDSTSIQRTLDQASAQARSGTPQVAATGFQQILNAQPDHPLALRRYGQLLYRTGDFVNALEMCHRCVNVQPDNASAWRLIGKSCLSLTRFLDAESAFRTANTLEPTVSAHYYLGKTLLKLQRDADASQAFHEALRLTPRGHRERAQQEKVRLQFVQP